MTITITWGVFWLNCWRRMGCQVTLVTPSAYVSDWTLNTLEQHAIHKRLVEAACGYSSEPWRDSH